jgi:hypothetical protein
MNGRYIAHCAMGYIVPGCIAACGVIQVLIGDPVSAGICLSAAALISVAETKSVREYAEGVHRGRAEIIDTVEKAQREQEPVMSRLSRNPVPWDDWITPLSPEKWDA